jgi:hypothetical protein
MTRRFYAGPVLKGVKGAGKICLPANHKESKKKVMKGNQMDTISSRFIAKKLTRNGKTFSENS